MTSFNQLAEDALQNFEDKDYDNLESNLRNLSRLTFKQEPGAGFDAAYEVISNSKRPKAGKKALDALISDFRDRYEGDPDEVEEEEPEQVRGAKVSRRRGSTGSEGRPTKTRASEEETLGEAEKSNYTTFDSPYGDKELIYFFARFNLATTKGSIANGNNQIALKALLSTSPLIVNNETGKASNPFQKWITRDEILDVDIPFIRRKIIRLLQNVEGSNAEIPFTVAGNLTSGQNRLELYSPKPEDAKTLYFQEKSNVEDLAPTSKKLVKSMEPIVLLYSRHPTKKGLIGRKNDEEEELFEATGSISEIQTNRSKDAIKAHRALLIACYKGHEEKQNAALEDISFCVRIHYLLSKRYGGSSDVLFGAKSRTKLVDVARYDDKRQKPSRKDMLAEGDTKFSMVIGNDELTVMQYRLSSLEKNASKYGRIRNHRLPGLFSVYYGTPGFIKWVNEETYGLLEYENFKTKAPGYFTVWNSEAKNGKGELTPVMRNKKPVNFWDYFAKLAAEEMEKYYTKSGKEGNRYPENGYKKVVDAIAGLRRDDLDGYKPKTLLQCGVVIDAAKLGVSNLTLRSFSQINKTQYLAFDVDDPKYNPKYPDRYGAITEKKKRETKGGGPIFYFTASDALRTVLGETSDIYYDDASGTLVAQPQIGGDLTLEEVLAGKIIRKPKVVLVKDPKTGKPKMKEEKPEPGFTAGKFLASDLMTILATFSYKKTHTAKYPVWAKNVSMGTTVPETQVPGTNITYRDLRNAMIAERVALIKAKIYSSAGKDKYKAENAKNIAKQTRDKNEDLYIRQTEKEAAKLNKWLKGYGFTSKETK